LKQLYLVHLYHHAMNLNERVLVTVDPSLVEEQAAEIGARSHLIEDGWRHINTSFVCRTPDPVQRTTHAA
jgi:hypothetical protein